jgi:hypothetical protein
VWSAVVWTTFLHKIKVEIEKVAKFGEKTFGKMPQDLQDLILKTVAFIRLAKHLIIAEWKVDFGMLR